MLLSVKVLPRNRLRCVDYGQNHTLQFKYNQSLWIKRECQVHVLSLLLINIHASYFMTGAKNILEWNTVDIKWFKNGEMNKKCV